MQRWSVGARGRPPVEVEARTWLVALGLGLERLDVGHNLTRLACEVLPNGTVIARDIASGGSFVCQPLEREDEIHRELTEELIELSGESDPALMIGEASDVHTACRLALDSLRGHSDAESGAVLLAAGDHLRFTHAFGARAHELLPLDVPLGEGIAGHAMRHRRIVVLANTVDDPRHFSGVDQVLGADTRALAAFPVAHGAALYGVIELVNLPEGKRFTRAMVHHAHVVARQLGARLAFLGQASVVVA